MKTLLVFLTLTGLLATAGCDRRKEQPLEGSETIESSAPAAPGTPVASPSDQQTSGGAAPDPCAGLADQALRDCQTEHIQQRREAADAKKDGTDTAPQ